MSGVFVRIVGKNARKGVLASFHIRKLAPEDRSQFI
jgi:hypothetical protein